MARLPKRIKQYIVRCTARFDSPAEVARLVQEEFGVEISRQRVSLYDPTKSGGRTLSPPLRSLFETERQRFIDEIKELPLSHRATRLHTLQRLLETAEGAGNLKAALAAVGLAQREMQQLEWTKDDLDPDPTPDGNWNTTP